MSKHLPPHMFKSPNGNYRYRRTVPEALRETLGVREVKKALGKEYTAALSRYGVVHRETESMFASRAPASDRDKVIHLLRKAGITRQQLELLITNPAPEGTPEAASAAEGLWLLVGSELEDEYTAARRAGKDPRVSLEAIQSVNSGRIPAQTHTIASALAFYVEGKKGEDAAKDRQLENRVESLKARIVAVLGKDAVNKRSLERFTRDDARKVRDHLLTQIHPNSVKREFGVLRTAINKTILEFGLDIRNHTAQLEIKGAGISRDDRLPFTEGDMAALALVMVKDEDDTLGILWTTIRDTGARPSEICRRKVADVDLEQGCISIRMGKSKNAVRVVPLSPSALEGLSRIIKGKAGDEYVFPSYATGRGPDSVSAALVKRLRTVIDDPKKVVYSLRHRMKDRLRETGCPADIQEEIMGHATQSIPKNYGSGYSLERKREYLQRVWG